MPERFMMLADAHSKQCGLLQSAGVCSDCSEAEVSLDFIAFLSLSDFLVFCFDFDCTIGVFCVFDCVIVAVDVVVVDVEACGACVVVWLVLL